MHGGARTSNLAHDSESREMNSRLSITSYQRYTGGPTRNVRALLMLKCTLFVVGIESILYWHFHGRLLWIECPQAGILQDANWSLRFFVGRGTPCGDCRHLHPWGLGWRTSESFEEPPLKTQGGRGHPSPHWLWAWHDSKAANGFMAEFRDPAYRDQWQVLCWAEWFLENPAQVMVLMVLILAWCWYLVRVRACIHDRTNTFTVC